MTAQRRAAAKEAAVAADSIGGPNPIVGFRRADLLAVVVRRSARWVAAEALRNRRHTTHSLLRLADAMMDPARGLMIHQPAAKDRRFADCAWSEDFLYRVLPQLRRFEVGVSLATTAGGRPNPTAAHRNSDLDTPMREALDVGRAIAGCHEVNLTGAGSGGIVRTWNRDITRLPAAPHGQLINIYRDNTNFLNTDLSRPAKKWRAGATRGAGSERRPAPQSLGNRRYASLESAPGSYVFERSL